MPPAPLPDHEAERLAALRSYDVLDTACEAVFDEIARLAARLTGCPIALVSLVDADRQWFKARYGLDATETPRDIAFCAYAILDPEHPLLVPDAAEDRRFAGNPLVTGPAGLRAYAGVPLVNPEGFALGTLCVMDRRPRHLTPDQVEILAGLARSAATALELHRAMRRARDLALTDGLTGLPNRSALLHALDRTLARQRRDGQGQERQGLALLYLDLDGFKAVNDGGGHAAGDAVLQEVAAVLRACIRPMDMAARVGGDEFAVLLGSAAGVPAAAERIRARIAAAMANRSCPVTASVGAVTFLTAPASMDAALAAVDAAMYESKVAGRNQVCHRVHGHRPAETAAA
jgi:diguanylate cyclase (GGDEF)-like protein